MHPNEKYTFIQGPEGGEVKRGWKLTDYGNWLTDYGEYFFPR